MACASPAPMQQTVDLLSCIANFKKEQLKGQGVAATQEVLLEATKLWKS